MIVRLLGCVILVSVLTRVSLPAAAADEVSGQEASSALTEEQKARKERLEYERDVVTLEKEIRDAKKIEGNVAPLEGKVTTEKVELEGTILAYRELPEMARLVVDAVNDASLGDNANIVLTADSSLVSSLNIYRAFSSQLEVAGGEYDRITTILSEQGGEKVAITSIATLTNSLGALATAGALFRVDREIKGFSVTIDEDAMASAVARILLQEGYRVSYAKLGFKLSAESNLRRSIEEIAGKKSQVQELVDKQTKESARLTKGLAEVEGKIKAAESETDKQELRKIKEQLELQLELRKPIRDAVESAKKLNAIVGTTLENLRASGVDSLFARLLYAETVAGNITSGGLLYIKPVAGGGATETKRNLLWTSVRYSGGAVATYWLVDSDGRILSTGNVDGYRGRIKSGNIDGN